MPYKTRGKMFRLVQKLVPQSRVGIFRNESTRSTPLDPKLTFCTNWMHSGPFGCLTKLGAKWSELVQKFVKRSRIGIFRNERTRWYETHQNMSLGSNGVDRVVLLRNVRATKSRRNFSQRTHPIHPIDPKLIFWCVLYRLRASGTVKLPYETRGKMF